VAGIARPTSWWGAAAPSSTPTNSVPAGPNYRGLFARHDGHVPVRKALSTSAEPAAAAGVVSASVPTAASSSGSAR
jgi:hypothetical protein